MTFGEATRRDVVRLIEEWGDALAADPTEAAGVLPDYLASSEQGNGRLVKALIATTGPTLRDAGASGKLHETEHAVLHRQGIAEGVSGDDVEWAIGTWAAALSLNTPVDEPKPNVDPAPAKRPPDPTSPPTRVLVPPLEPSSSRTPRRNWIFAAAVCVLAGIAAVAATSLGGADEGPIIEGEDSIISLDSTNTEVPAGPEGDQAGPNGQVEMVFAVAEPSGLIVQRTWILNDSGFDAQICLQATADYLDLFDEPIPPGLEALKEDVSFPDDLRVQFSDPPNLVARFAIELTAGERQEVRYTVARAPIDEATPHLLAELQNGWVASWRKSRDFSEAISYQTDPIAEMAEGPVELGSCD